MNLNKLFINYCKKNNLEINPDQINIIEELNKFYNLNFNKSIKIVYIDTFVRAPNQSDLGELQCIKTVTDTK